MAIVAEILSTQDVDDGRRIVHYRWTVTPRGGGPPETGEGTAISPIEPVAPDILMDRWRGMMGTMQPTKLQNRVDRLLSDLAEALTRRGVNDKPAVVDGEVMNMDMVMDLDKLGRVIRDWMLERAGKVALR